MNNKMQMKCISHTEILQEGPKKKTTKTFCLCGQCSY